jgi:hypothetical protein
MKKYKIACQIRLECPAFICNPQLVNILDRDMYSKFSNQLGTSVMAINNKVQQRENFKDCDVESDVKRYIYITAMNHLFIYEKIQISQIVSSIHMKEEDIIYVLKVLFGNNILKYL